MELRQIPVILLVMLAVDLGITQVQYNINSSVTNNIHGNNITYINTSNYFYAIGSNGTSKMMEMLKKASEQIMDDMRPQSGIQELDLSSKEIAIQIPFTTTTRADILIIPTTIITPETPDNRDWQFNNNQKPRGDFNPGNPKNSSNDRRRVNMVSNMNWGKFNGEKSFHASEPEDDYQIVKYVLNVCFEKSLPYINDEMSLLRTLTDDLKEIKSHFLNNPPKSLVNLTSIFLIQAKLTATHSLRPGYDTCMLEQIRKVGETVISVIRDAVTTYIHENNHKDDKASNMSGRKKREVSDSEIRELTNKASDTIFMNLKESGVLLSGMEDFVDKINKTNSSTMAPEFDMKWVDALKGKTQIDFYPSLDWKAPLESILIDTKDSKRLMSTIEIIRSFKIMKEMSKCTFLLTLDIGKLKCVKAMLLISEESGRLCLIAPSCPTSLESNYTCSVEPQSCKTQRIITNFRSSGFLTTKKSRSTFISAINKDSSSSILNFPSDSIRICSISKFWEDSTCVDRVHLFGQITYSIYENGDMVVTPLVNPKQSFLYDPKDPSSYNCVNDSCSEIPIPDFCSGDRTYCQELNQKCKIGAPISCKVIDNFVNLVNSSTGSKLVIQLKVWEGVTYELNDGLKENFLPMVRKFDDLGDDMLFPGCEVNTTCLSSIITVRSSCGITTSVISAGFNSFLTHSDNTTFLDLPVPFSTFRNGQKIGLKLFNHGMLIYKDKLTCLEFDACSKINCQFCLISLRHPICLNETTKIMLIVIFILIIVSCVFVILYLTRRMTTVARVASKASIGAIRRLARIGNPRSSLRSLRSRFMSGIMDRHDKTQSIESPSNEVSSREDVIIPMDQGSSLVQKRRYTTRPLRLKSSPMFCILIVLVILPDFVRSCSESTSLITEKKDCEIDTQGKTSCMITSQVRISGSPSGQESCLNLYAENNDLMGYISFKTKWFAYHCSKNLLYYTFQSNLISDTENGCAGTDICPSWTRCTEFLTDPNVRNKMFSDSINKLEVHDCFNPGGCAGNRCFRCDNGCSFFSGHFLNDAGIAYEVFSCSSWIPRFYVEVKFHGLNNFDDFESVLTPEMGYQAQGIKVSLVSHSNPIIDNDFCFIKHPKGVAYGSCQTQTELMTGSIGEIRCPTEASALNADSQCHKARELVTLRPVNWDWFVINNQINISKVINKGSLPRSHGIMLLETTVDGQVGMRLTKGESFEIQVDMAQSHLAFRSQKSTCYGEHLSIEGCYSCLTGASLSITLWSTSDSTLALITCSDSISLPLVISKDKKSYNKTIMVTNENVKGPCSIKCSGNVLTINAEVKLRRQVELDIEGDDKGHVTTNNSSRPSSFNIIMSNWRLFVPLFSFGTIFMMISVAYCLYQVCKSSQSMPVTILPLISKTTKTS